MFLGKLCLQCVNSRKDIQTDGRTDRQNNGKLNDSRSWLYIRELQIVIFEVQYIHNISISLVNMENYLITSKIPITTMKKYVTLFFMMFVCMYVSLLVRVCSDHTIFLRPLTGVQLFETFFLDELLFFFCTFLKALLNWMRNYERLLICI